MPRSKQNNKTDTLEPYRQMSVAQLKEKCKSLTEEFQAIRTVLKEILELSSGIAGELGELPDPFRVNPFSPGNSSSSTTGVSYPTTSSYNPVNSAIPVSKSQLEDLEGFEIAARPMEPGEPEVASFGLEVAPVADLPEAFGVQAPTDLPILPSLEETTRVLEARIQELKEEAGVE